MPKVTLTVPNQAVDAICTTEGYQAVFEDGTPNPQTKGQFAVMWFQELIYRKMEKAEVPVAEQAAAEAKTTEIRQRTVTVTAT